MSNSGAAARLVVICVVTPSIKLEGTSAVSTHHARRRLVWPDNVSFDVCDLDERIPADDDSVSFAVANFGAASELRSDLITELSRILTPGGRALLSFYNRDALVNHWTYPWPATIHSHLNPHNDTLEVWSNDSVYTVRARGVSADDVLRECDAAGLTGLLCETYPTLQPILPNFIVRNPRARAVYEIGHYLDDFLASPEVGKGTYIIVEVRK